MLFFSLVLASVGTFAQAYSQGAGETSYSSGGNIPQADLGSYAPSAGYSSGSISGSVGSSGYENGPGVVQVAVRSAHNTQYYGVDSAPAYITPTNLHLSSQSAPLNMMFSTMPGPININHNYVRSPGSFRETESVEEPHRLVHTVRRPIIQEVREIITPLRVVRQEIRPVEESIQTIVARNNAFGGNGAGNGAGFGGGIAGGVAGSTGFDAGNNAELITGFGGAGNGNLAAPVILASGAGGNFGGRGGAGRRHRSRRPRGPRPIVSLPVGELAQTGQLNAGFGEPAVQNLVNVNPIPVQIVEDVVNVGVVGPRGCGGPSNPGCKSIPYY